MSTITDLPTDDGTPASLPFPSLPALRAAHNELLQLRRDAGLAGASTRSERRTDPPAVRLVEAARVFLRRAQVTGALLDIDDERVAAQSMLTYWANVIQRLGHEVEEALLDEFDAERAPELPDAACPYPGLEAFREEDSERFFGREALVDELMARLADERLLIVVGPAGSGKSSLLRAGLVPALRRDGLPGSADWRYLTPAVPGAEPLAALARLIRPGESRMQAAQRARQLRERPTSAPEMLLDPEAPPALILIDQFEEVFSLAESEEERAAFVAALLAIADDPASPHRVLLAMRSEAEPFVASLPELQERMARARAPLTPMSAAELREAIEGPARVAGLRFDPSVVDLLVQDLVGEPAGLPLLQFSLLRLWEQRDHNRISLEAYERVGGGRQALARAADAFYESLAPDEQQTVRSLLLRMVRPGEGQETASSRIRRDALYAIGEDPSQVDMLVQRLVEARLVRLTPGDAQRPSYLEVAHDALARNWPRLVGWLDEEKLALSTRRRLEQQTQEWLRLGGGSAGLLDETQLREAERWLASPEANYLGYDPALPRLIVASSEALRAAEREREAARERELEQARALAREQQARAEAEAARANAERRSRNILRLLTAALAVLAVTAIWLGLQARGLATAEATQRATAEAGATTSALLQQTAESAAAREAQLRATAEAAGLAAANSAEAADIQRQLAERQSDLARAGELAARAQAAFAARPPAPQLSLLLAVEATRVGDSPAPIAEDVLREALLRAQGEGLGQHPDAITAAAVTADGTLVATAGAGGDVLLWDPAAEPGAAMRAELSDLGAPARALALSADGAWLAVAGDERALLYRLSGGSAAGAPLDIGATGVRALGISPGPSPWLIAAGTDGSLRGWQLTGDQLGQPTVFTDRAAPMNGAVEALAFSPNGTLLFSGGADGRVRLWNLGAIGAATSRFISRLDPLERPVSEIALSPDGRWMAAGTRNGSILMWPLNDSGFTGRPSLKTGHQGAISTLDFSPDGRWLLSGSADRNARLWAAADFPFNGAESIVLTGHTQTITSATFDADSQLVVTGSSDRELLVWNLSNPSVEASHLRGHDGEVVAVLASGGRLLSAGADGQLRRWSFPPAPEDQRAAELAGLGLTELQSMACRIAGRSLSTTEAAGLFAGDPPETCPAP